MLWTTFTYTRTTTKTKHCIACGVKCRHFIFPLILTYKQLFIPQYNKHQQRRLHNYYIAAIGKCNVCCVLV